ncbi:MAG: site-specific integrase [Beijerinckiaceae bacterium]|nr:site-specific integrase [Beijerinckiaceae bacterium]
MANDVSPVERAAVHVVVQAGPTGQPVYMAMWRHRRDDGTTRLMKRRIGPAWLTRSRSGEWVKRRGRVAADHFDERAATVEAAALMERVEAELLAAAADDDQTRRGAVTFRAVAADFLAHREHVKGSRPSTLADYRSMLAEPGVPLQRRFEKDEHGNVKRDAKGHPVHAVTEGWIMRRIGDKPATKVTTRDIEAILRDLSKSGRGPTTVNKYRALLSSIFNYARRGSTFGLPTNPVEDADRRRQPPPKAIEFYSVEEIEALARALAAGAHRGEQRPTLTEEEVEQNRRDDAQDAELVRVAAYVGLRRSELIALRWRDFDIATRQLHVRRTISAGVEVDAPKSGKQRSVPLSDRAAGALDRLSQRDDFTGLDDYVAVNAAGERIDDSALAMRVRKAQENAGLRRLALHGLRHSFASQLVAAGLGLADVQKALGHAKIETTGRYLHARPAHELAAAFSRAQAGTTPVPESSVADFAS